MGECGEIMGGQVVKVKGPSHSLCAVTQSLCCILCKAVYLSIHVLAASIGRGVRVQLRTALTAIHSVWYV